MGGIFFILLIAIAIETAYLYCMSPWYFRKGFEIYRKNYDLDFERGGQLKIKKLRERLERNLNWIWHDQLVFHRLNSREIVFREQWDRWLAKSFGSLMRGHVVLNPESNTFTIIGRLNFYMLALDVIMVVAAYRTIEDPLWSVVAAVVAAIFLGLFSAKSLFKYQKERYEELAMAISDAIESPNKTFDFAPYSRQTR
jgi:hypothetical protein